ncbi:Hypothetical Protein PANA_1032 [Pantoea ananatis LMG 20103]|uniref:Uncharacterized protein n=1 Tax=Pantoea ananatis (strain LMG 20103) TaxID=706191 RepID=D4GLS9_PANAM|nr:Hypothetical Protein PANA_1032 [Pantoea ananatis LMG 20103]
MRGFQAGVFHNTGKRLKFNLLTTGEGVGQRGAIDHFQFTAHRNPMRNTARVDAILSAQFSDVVRGSFTFNRGIGRQNHFVKRFVFQPLFQSVKTNIGWTNTVQRRKMPHQHEIAAGKLPGLLNSMDVCRALNHADLTILLTPGIGANGANFLLGEGAAIGTVADFRHRPGQGLRQTHSATPIAL